MESMENKETLAKKEIRVVLKAMPEIMVKMEWTETKGKLGKREIKVKIY